MPKRTNPFQETIALLQQHLGGASTITQSDLLVDRVTGDSREVDVCIRGDIAGQQVLISIECRDHKRPQTVSWIDEMKSKHETLPTNSLILVSSSGFTRGAIAKATKFGITTVHPSEMTDESATKMIESLKAHVFRTNQLRVLVVRVTVQTSDGPVDDLRPLEKDTVAYSVTGKPAGLVATFVSATLNMVQIPELEGMDVDETRAFRIVTGTPQMRVQGAPLEDVYLQEESTPPRLVKILKMVIDGEADRTTSTFPMTFGQFNGIPFGSGRATVAGRPAIMVVTQQDGIEQFSVKVIGEN